MNPLKFQLQQLVKLMKDAKVNYAVLGGVAVSIYGEPRLTFDIDVSLLLDKDKMDVFLKKAKKFGFLPLPSNIKGFVKATGVIPMRFFKNKITGRCNFIIAQNALEYLCIKRGRFRKIYSVKVRLISPEDLVIHKITSQRPRDLEDVQGILIRQEGKLDIKYITHWLKKIAEINHKPELLKLFKNLL
jgi:hypothetical protein